jgi:hypothetical protein
MHNILLALNVPRRIHHYLQMVRIDVRYLYVSALHKKGRDSRGFSAALFLRNAHDLCVVEVLFCTYGAHFA